MGHIQFLQRLGTRLRARDKLLEGGWEGEREGRERGRVGGEGGREGGRGGREGGRVGGEGGISLTYQHG